MKTLYFAIVLILTLSINALAINAPNLYTLSNGAAYQDIGETLDWYSVSNNEGYRYQVDVTPNFNSPDLIDETTNNSYTTVFNLHFGTTYYWRVMPLKSSGNSVWSSVWNFTTESISLESPQLLFPLNNSTNLDVGIISLEWLFVVDATEYTCQISTDNTFTSDVVSETTTSTYKELTNLSTNTEYFWRVKASNNLGESDWSQTWRFSTFGFSDVPNLEDDNAPKVYPNPSNRIFTLEGDGINAIEIVDSKEQIVSKNLIDKDITLIDISNQPKGMYFLKVFSKESVLYKNC